MFFQKKHMTNKYLTTPGYSCPHTAKVTRLPKNDLYRIELDNFHNVDSWIFQGNKVRRFKTNKTYDFAIIC